MRIVISDNETIPEWLYPGSWPDLVTPPENVLASVDRSDLNRLWDTVQPGTVRDDLLIYQAYSAVGIPHSAPQHVYCLNVEFVEALVVVPAHDRWRIAQRWTGTNKEKLADAKVVLNKLCDLALRALASDKMLVILPDEGTY